MIYLISKRVVMKNDRHTQTFPSAVLPQAQEKIDEAMPLLAPYLLELTLVERQKLPKMGEKPIGFVEKAHDFAQKNLAHIPPYLDLAAFGADFADAHALWTLLNSVRQVEEGIDDTEMTAGSEGVSGGWCFTNPSKMAASQDIPGAKAVYEELRTRLSQGGRPRAASYPDNAASS
jgi:hypothetical protein